MPAAPMAVDIRTARSYRDRRAFIELPFRLHAGTSWVPPLVLERLIFLSPRLGQFFKHGRGEVQLFLAERDGRVVGRISAQIDHAYNRHHDARWGWFGFFEAEDDQDVADALLAAAEEWLRARGMERMVGPADFTMNDESGIVIEGHEHRPMIRQPWHPPYYQRLCEGAGLTKEVDLLMWNLEISDREKMLPVLFELAEQVEPKHGVRIRRMSRRHLRRDLDAFAEIYNRAWRRNFGFVPYTDADVDAYAQELQLVYDRDWFMLAEHADGEHVAMAITVPDVNQVLERMNGRLLPLGWWHFLRRGRLIDRVRVGFLGVKPEYQHTGVAAALYVEHFETSARHPRVKGGEMGWILETNTAMNRGMEAMNGRVIKRYRIYARDL
jgi:GNAT superfamily N-acetyltransferase